MIITPEMYEFFALDLDRHRGQIKEAAEIIVAAYPELNSLLNRAIMHDYSKKKKEVFDDYVVYIWNWEYFKKYGTCLKGYNKSKYDKLLAKHSRMEPHHPEYHKDYQMSNVDIAEMVCDWYSVGITRPGGCTMREWADKTVNKKWKFTERQVKLIYNLITLLEGKNGKNQPFRF